MATNRVYTWELSDSEPETVSDDNLKDHSHVHGKDVNILRVDEVTRTADDPRYGKVLELPNRIETTSPSPGKKRRSRDEIEADRLRAEEKRADRERAKRERDKKKQAKKLEQQQRKDAAERLKSYRPENYVKCFTVRIHPVLLQDENSDVLTQTLSELEWKNTIDPHTLTHSITWTRNLPLEGTYEAEEDQVLMVVSLFEFMEIVGSVKQTLKGCQSKESSLLAALSAHLSAHTGSVVTVLVISPGQSHKRGSWFHSHGALRSKLGMEDVEIEEVLVYLQLYKSVCVHFLYSWKEVTDQVCTYTKALSKRPFKALSECTDLGFCVDGSWAAGARVERDGKGLSEVWSRQIQQLNRVSPAMAEAVVTAYPSPQLLLQAYERLESDKEKRSLLEDLRVKGMVKDRRIGPEVSARIYRVLTSDNAELVLG